MTLLSVDFFHSLLISIFVIIFVINLMQNLSQIDPVLSASLFYLNRYLTRIFLFIVTFGFFINFTMTFNPAPSTLALTFISISLLIWTAFILFIYRRFILSPKVILVGNPDQIEDVLFKTINNFFYLKHAIKEIKFGDYSYFKLLNHPSYKSPFLCIEKKSSKNRNYFSYEISFEAEQDIISNSDFNMLIREVYSQIPKPKSYLTHSLLFFINIGILYGIGYHSQQWYLAFIIMGINERFFNEKFFKDPGPFYHQNFELFELRRSTL